jgi:exonuclease III
VLLVSWNLAGRVTRLGEQAERLVALDADVICVQELTGRTLPLWRERLLDADTSQSSTPIPQPAPPAPARSLC